MKKNYTLSAMLFALLYVIATNSNAQCTVNCGTGSNGVYLATTNTTLAGGTYNYTSFTINPGITVTVTGTQALIIYCTGNVQIDGVLNANGGIGGNGVTFSTFGTGGIGVAGGANGGDGVYLGSGAPGQNGFGLGAGNGGLGWSGGGGSGFTTVGANSGGGGGLGGPAYGTANLTPLYGGSGGGGGSGGNSCGSGGGGGGGGVISIQACGSITIGAAGQILANGGNGGSDGGGNCGSGAGGSGGSIWLSTSGSITNNGTIAANGGVGGASTIGGPPYYGVGGTGSVGRIRFDYAVLSGTGTTSPTVGYTGTLLGVTISSTPVSCASGSNGTATVTATGGTSPYTYAWAPIGGTNPTANGLSAGTYTCTVTDFVGCVSVSTVTVTEPTAITASITSTPTSCFGNCNGVASVVVSGGTPGYSYSWAPGGGTTPTVSGLCAGNYTCTITDANGCINTQTIVVTQPSALIDNITVTQNLCNGQCLASATANPSGGTAPYTFTNLANLCEGSYSMTITDANGCATSPTVSIVDPTVLSATFTATMPTCNASCDGSTTVSPSGGTPGYTYSWAPVVSTQATITGLCAGIYTCTITDANGCTTTVTVVISNPQAVSANSSSQNESCFGSADGWIAVSPTGGSAPYAYSWLPIASTNDTLNNISAGCYTVTVTDANGCVVNEVVCITSPSQIVPVVVQNNSPACFGDCTGAATVNATGGNPPYAWLWTPTGCTSESCVALCAGTYSVVITDSTGCTATINVDITEPTPVVAISSHTNAATTTSNDGTLTGSATGGTPGYTYTWNPGNLSGANQSGMAPGTYTLTACDANNCCDTSVTTIGVTSGVGIAVVSETDFSVNLFPNPAADHLDISVTNIKKGNVRLEVYNLLGEKIDVVDFGNVSNVNHAYNTAVLTNGIYFFRISSGAGTVTRKITVSH